MDVRAGLHRPFLPLPLKVVRQNRLRYNGRENQ